MIHSKAEIGLGDTGNPMADSIAVWKKLTITGVHHAGKRYTITVTPAGHTVTAE